MTDFKSTFNNITIALPDGSTKEFEVELRSTTLAVRLSEVEGITTYVYGDTYAELAEKVQRKVAEAFFERKHKADVAASRRRARKVEADALAAKTADSTRSTRVLISNRGEVLTYRGVHRGRNLTGLVTFPDGRKDSVAEYEARWGTVGDAEELTELIAKEEAVRKELLAYEEAHAANLRPSYFFTENDYATRADGTQVRIPILVVQHYGEDGTERKEYFVTAVGDEFVIDGLRGSNIRELVLRVAVSTHPRQGERLLNVHATSSLTMEVDAAEASLDTSINPSALFRTTLDYDHWLRLTSDRESLRKQRAELWGNLDLPHFH